MQALVLTAPNDFRVKEVPDPKPGPFEVLCRVERVGICGTDVHMIHGDYPMWPAFYPFTPGHEWSGQIVELGAGAEEFGWAVGDRVVGSSHAPCSFCANCIRGRYNLCLSYNNPKLHSHYGHTKQGSYAEYVVHSIRSVFKIPGGLSYDEAAVADPASIALHCANRGQVSDGHTVGVIGAGPVGILAAEAARTLGASRVVFAARGARLGVVESLGFEVVDTNVDDPAGAFRDVVGRGADVVLDAAGTPQSIPMALGMLAAGGRCATVGIPTSDVTASLSQLVLNELELVGSRAVTGEMAAVLDFIADGRVRAGKMITHRFPLADFGTALDVADRRTDGALKVLIDMSLS
ncbi:MAG TPA: alcohol dehydrogenase catalytic domain-containing protein [Microbacterium sp.]|uniref:zinc-dependent alcohol dehydrogenase n=1 Tax=Microbacterium sp. TaxID=51671 RepID=UPI002C2ECEF1|nr:alcohol dehydrogenase catalytic domain-containing protein [Microbacterium sp.]HWI32172.1 alcohol dehydrogenase catalytic domain-containing protein [Microbacterium sp.]